MMDPMALFLLQHSVTFFAFSLVVFAFGFRQFFCDTVFFIVYLGIESLRFCFAAHKEHYQLSSLLRTFISQKRVQAKKQSHQKFHWHMCAQTDRQTDLSQAFDCVNSLGLFTGLGEAIFPVSGNGLNEQNRLEEKMDTCMDGLFAGCFSY